MESNQFSTPKSIIEKRVQSIELHRSAIFAVFKLLQHHSIKTVLEIILEKTKNNRNLILWTE